MSETTETGVVWPDEAREGAAEAIVGEDPCPKPWRTDQCWVHHGGFERHADRWCDSVMDAADAALAALAPHVAAMLDQAHAEALREAADAIDDVPSARDCAVYGFEREHADGVDSGMDQAADMLRERAARVDGAS